NQPVPAMAVQKRKDVEALARRPGDRREGPEKIARAQRAALAVRPPGLAGKGRIGDDDDLAIGPRRARRRADEVASAGHVRDLIPLHEKLAGGIAKSRKGQRIQGAVRADENLLRRAERLFQGSPDAHIRVAGGPRSRVWSVALAR